MSDVTARVTKMTEAMKQTLKDSGNTAIAHLSKTDGDSQRRSAVRKSRSMYAATMP